MNRLRWVFQLSVTVLLALSAAMFAAAEENPLAGATVPLAVFCWLAIDRRNRGGVGPGMGLVLGLSALAAAVAEFVHGGIESRLLAPAHLLVYLMWLFLLQRKQPRHYWMLLGLCVLQVAVASLLTNDPWFGLALIAFAALGLWTLGVFNLYRAALQVEAEVFAAPGAVEAGRSPTAATFGSPAELLSAGSTVRNAVHLDPGDRLIGAHFAGGALVMVVLSLAVSGVFFLFIPRIWIAGFRMFDDSPISGSRPLTGFTEQVTLGDMGEILENDDLVMQIALFDHTTGAAIPANRIDQELGSDPLFRGNALEVYANGRWSQNPRRRWYRTTSAPPDDATLRLTVQIEPIGTPTLFGTGQVVTCTPLDGRERIERTRESRLYRRFDDADLSRPFHYDAMAAETEPLRSRLFSTNFTEYLERCRQLPAGVERVAQAARAHVLSGEAGPARTRADAASRLEIWLRDSGEFRYSLNLAIQDPNVDPIEDFLFNRKEGHCEYFASALAVMLRGVGIPSRVISGFKGGLVNPGTGQFEVRQLHAHAWVEAYVDEDWIALDPTPPAREARVAQLQAQTGSIWARWRQHWQVTWNSGLRLSRAEQEELVYRPLQETFANLWESLRDARGTSASVAEFVRGLAQSPERWFSWRGGVAVFVLLVLGAAVWRIGRTFWSAVRRMRGGTAETGRAAGTVEFYDRFRKIMARTGLERPHAETQREFAGHVGRHLAQPLQAYGLQALPADVADRFYRVRYGNQQLSDEERTAVAADLDALERCVVDTGSNGRPR